MRRKRLGLIVNPIAGMGGAVALKGTDGDALPRARERGAIALAEMRSRQCLGVLSPRAGEIELLTGSGEMGEIVARQCGFLPVVVHSSSGRASTAADTIAAAETMMNDGVDLLLFAGGDGTARDVFSAVGSSIPILGIPAGVKMHSAVFATTPRSAGRVALAVLGTEGAEPPLRDAEIMDREPEAAGASPLLFGYAKTPYLPHMVQHAKSSAGTSEEADLDGAIAEIARILLDDRLSIIGPGTTMAQLKRSLGFEGTLLGVDTARSGRLVAADTGEADLLALLEGGPARIVVGVVGGQGYLFGRGNQQISARVIQSVGVENIITVSTLGKLLALEDGQLYVDTGDESVDRMLAGYLRVATGPGRRTVVKVTGS